MITPEGNSPRKSGLKPGWVLAGILGVIFVVVVFDSDSKDSATPPVSADSEAAPVDIPSALPQPVPPPSPDQQSAARAARHLRMALDAEGFPGAMIYSQDCFASLDHRFSWAKLDQCGAFDTLATAGAEETLSSGPEYEYFTRAAMEQRYEAAAAKLSSSTTSVPDHFAGVENLAMARISELQSPQGTKSATSDQSGTTVANDNSEPVSAPSSVNDESED